MLSFNSAMWAATMACWMTSVLTLAVILKRVQFTSPGSWTARSGAPTVCCIRCCPKQWRSNSNRSEMSTPSTSRRWGHCTVTSGHGNTIYITAGPLWGECIHHQTTPLAKGQQCGALCFLFWYPECIAEQTADMPVISEVRRYCDVTVMDSLYHHTFYGLYWN